MANRMALLITLFVFAMVSVGLATDAPPATAAESPGTQNVIGGISGIPLDAAPVGGPVPNDVFPNLGPGVDTQKGAAPATAAGLVAASILVSSFSFSFSFFFFFS
ncbi:uncharacterized protein LOC127260535 [Andrographis paniculata]|uniref:uncharacterized protein LOC127260535 n=1 Tax=Andrographis paniculata TaxID=175694 RepID=UPI0021E8C2F1|nr:uncharacterized protein LOC127260535 [Andrographis paniculata]